MYIIRLLNHKMQEANSRNFSIDVLKCLAALLITNSHMELLYGKYNYLATGGCIGDALFFFISGFTLFLKPMEGVTSFPDWYKKRINRIYPSLIAVAFLGALFFNVHRDVIDIALAKGYWFVSCIMLYYVGIYFVGSYCKDKIFVVSLLVAIGTAIWFSFECHETGFSIYGRHYYIRWLLFFMFMLWGAKVGMLTDKIKINPLLDFVKLLLYVAIFYGLFICGTRFNNLVVFQYFSFMPLLCIMYYCYKVCASKISERIYRSRAGSFVIRFVGGLCLEIYIVQGFLFTDKMNSLFPLNILIMFLVIFVVAYLTKCLARFLLETFKDSHYDWGRIFSLY